MLNEQTIGKLERFEIQYHIRVLDTRKEVGVYWDIAVGREGRVSEYQIKHLALLKILPQNLQYNTF